MSGHVLAIDVGTHAVRAALVDLENFTVDCKVQRSINLRRLDHRQVEQDAQEIVTALEQNIADVVQQTDRLPVCAAIACQRSSVMAWDSHSKEPLGPVLSWQDTRAEDVLDRACESNRQIAQLSGLAVSAHYGASKIHWMIEQWNLQPQRHRVGPLVSYLINRLLKDDVYLCDYSIAARTQLLNWQTCDWDPQLLKAFAVDPRYLPQLRPSHSSYGQLAAVDIHLLAVAGDQNAAFFAQERNDGDARIHINLGSGAFAQRKIAPDDSVDPRLLISVAYSDSERKIVVQEGTVNGAGLALSHYYAQYVQQSNQNIAAFYAQIPQWLDRATTGEGWVYLNTLGGLGSPFWRTGLQPEFVALGESAVKHPTTSEAVVAVVESIVFLLCINCQFLQHSAAAKEIYVSGGLSRLAGLCQRLADLTLRPVQCVDDYEATLIGVAHIADGLKHSPSQSATEEYQPRLNPSLNRRFEFFYQQLQQRLAGAD